MSLELHIPPTSSSFRSEYTVRPSGFQTPPPPLGDVEPLSPILRPAGTGHSPRLEVKKRKLIDSHLEDAQIYGPLPKNGYRYSHAHTSSAPSHTSPLRLGGRYTQQNPSALDLFATVATSPSIAQASFSPTYKESHDRSTFPPHAPIHLRGPYDGRSSKRSRSEIIDAASVVDAVSRPATSHIIQGAWGLNSEQGPAGYSITHGSEPSRRLGGSQDHSVEDAELLLSFAYGANFKPKPRHGQQLPVVYAIEDLPTANGSDSFRHYQAPYDKQDQYVHTLGSNGEEEHRDISGGRQVDSAFAESVSRNQYFSTDQAVKAPGFLNPVTEHDDKQELIASASEQPASKPRANRGWPRGKPRGPRSSAGQIKQTKKAPGKPRASNTGVNREAQYRKASASSSVPSSRLTSREHHANSKLPKEIAGAHPHMINSLVECREQLRPRSASEAQMPSSFMNSRFIPPRRHSSPPSFILPSVKIPTEALHRRARTKAGEDADGVKEANLCTLCQSKSTLNGYHDLWITCNGCRMWFHTACVGFKNEREVRDVDKFYCGACEDNGQKTTFVRKSSRAHISVDYAGLNEGKLRTSTDTVEHHYIQPFKDGTIEIQPESFPRMRPEYVTAEFFERSGAMTEPILIPAEWNPRPDPPAASSHSLHLGHGPALIGELESGEWFSEMFDYDCVPDDGQDKLDMVMPQGLTVPIVAELVGPEERVEVIDVKSQEGGDNRWNLRKWAEYYEATGEKPVRNVISLEVSQTKLGKLIRRPKVVRDLDLQDAVWPQDELAKGNYPQVQFYCLMSVQDCYTDFHIDFGGSSVYYHILKGSKTFFFIPPKKQHLKAYEQWCLSSHQGSTWLGSVTKECYRVDLTEGDTMLIPSGWIHSVWTPSNSLVIGGNFLTRMHYGMQIAVNDVEKATGVGRRFRYPHFQKVLWYAVIQYLEEDPVPSTVAQILYNGGQHERTRPSYHDFDTPEDQGPEQHHSRYYSQGEIEGLADLMRYVYRTVMISLDKVQGVTKSTKEAVIRSMPKGYGEHLDLLRTFALWVAWKRGNETLPSWAHPDYLISDLEVITTDKKPGIATIKKTEISAERRSSRQPKESAEQSSLLQPKSEGEGSAKCTPNGGSKSAPGPRRIACEACRKRRIRCKHKEAEEPHTPGPAQRFGIKAVQEVTPEPPPPPVEHVPMKPWAPVAVIIPQMQEVSTAPPHTPSTTQIGSSKVKACDECRKSKRRCIHDENGNVDPIKASQTPVPRAYSASKIGPKRGRPEGDSDSQSSNKRVKTDEQDTYSSGSSDAAQVDLQGLVVSDQSEEAMADFQDDLQTMQRSVDSATDGGRSSSYPDNTFVQPVDNPFAWAAEATYQARQALEAFQPMDNRTLAEQALSSAVDIPDISGKRYIGSPAKVQRKSSAPRRTNRVKPCIPETMGAADSPSTNVIASRTNGESVTELAPAEMRSRTSSLRINTSSTRSGDVTESTPSSPLTELEPSSPTADKVDKVDDEVTAKRENIGVIRRHSGRSASRRMATPTTSKEGWKRPPRTPATTAPLRSTSLKARIGARSHEQDSVPRISGFDNKISPINSPGISVPLDPSEEESLRLARELQGLDWGLRRRSR